MQSHFAVALVLSCTFALSNAFSLGSFIAPAPLSSTTIASRSLATVPALRVALGQRARLQSGTIALRAAGLYDNDDKPKAQKELLQVRFSNPDPARLTAWIQKWPTGGSKDGYGLPKLMLPVTCEKRGDGLKIIFKGSLDPWLQVELEGDTVRVYRCTGLATTSLQVSALKEREESKICDKLKTDLAALGEMKEKEIPVIKVEKPKETSEDASDADASAPEAKADDGDKPPPTPA